MKILLIHNIFFPEAFGGGERVVYNRARDFVRQGFNVTILVPGKKEETSIEESITIIRFRPLHIIQYRDANQHSRAVRLLWHILDLINIATYFQIRTKLKKINPDKVECHNLKGVGYLVPSAIRALRIPFSLYLHDVQLAIPSGILLKSKEYTSLMSGLFQKIYEHFTKSLIGSPDEVISPSIWLMGYYVQKGFFSSSLHTVLPSKLSSFDQAVLEKRLIDLKEKIKKNKMLKFLYIGKIEINKGIFFLLDVWKELPENYTLTIIGSGTDEIELQRRITDFPRIRYIGYKKHDEMVAYLKSSDALIMPSLCYENRPEVILEAYAHALPVIASELGGIPEIVLDQKIGYLFNPGNKNDLQSLLTT